MAALEGKIALVTGASRGLGSAIALELAQQGAVVAGTATSQTGADSISASFADMGLRGQGFVMDVTDQGSIDNALADITAAYESPLILVNNAGITSDNLLLRMRDEEWLSVIDTDLNSVYRLSKICLKSMIKARWGRIINISSVCGLSGNPGQTNYAAAKAGIVGFSKSLAQEVASRNITVNVVAPGLIDTDMNKALTEEQRKALLEKIPLGQLGKASDIAAAVAFLASPAAGYITGETLNVSGGMYMA